MAFSELVLMPVLNGTTGKKILPFLPPPPPPQALISSIVDLLQDLPNYLFVLHFTRGFPVWLHNIPEIKFRTDNEIFKV